MTILEATGVVVERGGRAVARADHVAIEEGETLAILGPNGAGKSSLLLALATLIPSRGEIRHRGASITDPVEFRRRVAVVFQRPLLLDRSVRDNAALGLEIRGVPRANARERATGALARFGVAHLAARSAATLSGGEAQRVSLARAFAVDPEILFLDEPFGALDEPTRESIVADLAQALGGTRMATIIVTHDRDEALSLADRTAVILAGRVRQVERTDAVFGRPADPEVAAFVGIENVLPARVVEVTPEITRLRVADTSIEVAALPPKGDDFPLLCVRPDDIVIQRGPTDTSARNTLAARVIRVEPAGRRVRVILDCGFPLIAHVTAQSARELALARDEHVTASFKATSPHLLPRHRGT